MKTLLTLTLLFLFKTTWDNQKDWTHFLHNPNYVIGYGFAGHDYPMIKTHPRISFRGGSFSTDAHQTCLEGDRIRTINKKKLCLQYRDEMVWNDTMDKKIKTGNRICAQPKRMVLTRPISGKKTICEKRKDIIKAWEEENPREKFNKESLATCTLKREIDVNTSIKFKIFVAEKRNHKNTNNYDKRWGGKPLFTQMWSIPKCDR